jgi:hypothetical protein
MSFNRWQNGHFRNNLILGGEPDPWDLRLKPDAAAVDRGCTQPTVNDSFRGTASDLGCYELGEARFTYGPR